MEVKEMLYNVAVILLLDVLYTGSLKPVRECLKDAWETKYYKKGYDVLANEF